MPLTLVEAPAFEPVTRDEAKLYARIDVDDDDDLIESLITAARESIESFCNRALITQSWDWKFDRFENDTIEIPKAPLQSVTSLTYTATDGIATVWTSDDYTVDAPSGPFAMPGRIIPDYGVSYPTHRNVPNAITVRFVAGYGDAQDVPETLKMAIKVFVAEAYKEREQSVVGLGMVAQVPFTVQRLCWPFRT